MLRLAYADSGSACKLAGVQIILLHAKAHRPVSNDEHQKASPAVGKFSRASSAGGRRHLQTKFVNRIVSVAEDCLSPERTFHGCLLMHFCCCFPGCFHGCPLMHFCCSSRGSNLVRVADSTQASRNQAIIHLGRQLAILTRFETHPPSVCAKIRHNWLDISMSSRR